MKKFIFTILLAITAVVNANAQSNICWTGNLGATMGIEPHNSELTSFPMTINGGVGALFASGVYAGVGMSLGAHCENYHSGGYSETESTFIMPFYLQLSYINPQRWYGDIKIGGESVSMDGMTKTFFYMSVTPLGYTFDYNNSIGIGWRYHAKNAFKGHAIAVTYTYTF